LTPIDTSLGGEELCQHVDEILYYVWDPLYVSDEPDAREQYSSYVPIIVSMVKSKLSEEQIAEYLEKIEQECKTNTAKHADIGLSRRGEREEWIAEILAKWRQEFSWREYLEKMSITERSKWVAEMLCSEHAMDSLQQTLAFRVKYYQEKESKLDSTDREMYKRIDEVLFYIWDPIGANAFVGAPTRDEYRSYVLSLLSLVKSGADKDAIAEHLGTIVYDTIGLSRCREREEKVAEILVKWRQKIYGDNK
jgi:hypothetical protein